MARTEVLRAKCKTHVVQGVKMPPLLITIPQASVCYFGVILRHIGMVHVKGTMTHTSMHDHWQIPLVEGTRFDFQIVQYDIPYIHKHTDIAVTRQPC